MQAIEVRVWDPLIRVVHWLLAAAVLIDWATDEPRWMHVWLGYLAGALVFLRIVWRFAGPENARFGSFVRAPRAVFDYLAGLIRFSSKRYLGHSPATIGSDRTHRSSPYVREFALTKWEPRNGPHVVKLPQRKIHPRNPLRHAHRRIERGGGTLCCPLR
jgi:hypothetical protein